MWPLEPTPLSYSWPAWNYGAEYQHPTKGTIAQPKGEGHAKWNLSGVFSLTYSTLRRIGVS